VSLQKLRIPMFVFERVAILAKMREKITEIMVKRLENMENITKNLVNLIISSNKR
jgi:hypothetical protein